MFTRQEIATLIFFGLAGTFYQYSTKRSSLTSVNTALFVRCARESPSF
jgi:hypothetical protein